LHQAESSPVPDDLLRQAIEAFGQSPRTFSLWDRLTYLHIPKPGWMKYSPRDDLRKVFKLKRALLAEGEIVWGMIVQANMKMFKPGAVNSPCDVVYSLADRDRVNPGHLQPIARKLFSLKGTQQSNPALAAIANHLTNERTRAFGLPVPPAISPAARCHMSSTLLVRKHPPGPQALRVVFSALGPPLRARRRSSIAGSVLASAACKSMVESWLGHSSPTGYTPPDRV
jgi:hypothetical protein